MGPIQQPMQQPVQPQPPKSGSVVKLIIRIALVVVLLVAIVALALDTLNRSQSTAAYQKVDELQQDFERIVTPEDVSEVVGRKPDSDKKEEGSEIVEVYRWTGLVRSYKLYVLYRMQSVWKDNERKQLYRLENISLNKPLYPGAPGGFDSSFTVDGSGSDEGAGLETDMNPPGEP